MGSFVICWPKSIQKGANWVLKRRNRTPAKLWDCAIPVIAQVHGNCLAGGTDLALHCDLVIAAEDARIGFPPVRSMGVPPTNMWLYHLGPQWTGILADQRCGIPGTGLRAGQLRLLHGHDARLAIGPQRQL